MTPSAKQAKEFDVLLRKWLRDNSCAPGFHVSTEKFFKKYGQVDSKLMHAWTDLLINFAILQLDYFDIAAHWNDSRRGESEDTHVHFTFSERIDFHRSVTTFIFRYRALWDKLFGVLILINYPEKYDVFMGSKSKKTYFFRLFKEGLSEKGRNLMTSLEGDLTLFEEQFRTPEIHGSGKARKWTFSLNSLEIAEGNEMFFLFRMYNVLINNFNAIADKLSVGSTAKKNYTNKEGSRWSVPSKKSKMEFVEIPDEMIVSLSEVEKKTIER